MMIRRIPQNMLLLPLLLLATTVRGYLSSSSPQTRSSSSWHHALHSESSKTTLSSSTVEESSSENATTASFGDVVRLSDRKPPSSSSPPLPVQNNLKTTMQRRNAIVAAASIVAGTTPWVWKYTHPTLPLQILQDLARRSDALTVIGRNGLPTVVDVWAPWCDTCLAAAPTLAAIEAQYAGRVNFVVVNGDSPQAANVIAKFGVDAIPHMAMVEADGSVSTALIGAIPKRVLEANIDVLLENAVQDQQKKPLPYPMMDVFAGRPEEARIVRF